MAQVPSGRERPARGLVVFAGPNGAGKTNVLEALGDWDPVARESFSRVGRSKSGMDPPAVNPFVVRFSYTHPSGGPDHEDLEALLLAPWREEGGKSNLGPRWRTASADPGRFASPLPLSASVGRKRSIPNRSAERNGARARMSPSAFHTGGRTIVKRLQRDPARLESLNLFRQIEAATEPVGDPAPLDDPKRIQRFVTVVTTGLGAAFSSASTLHGWLTQELFAAVVVPLGGVRLVQQLDAGDAYYAGVQPKLPDFLLVTEEGERLLVEVKSAPRDPSRGFSLSRGEVRGLRRYAELVGGRLLFAVYWVRLNMWSLTDLDTFRRSGDRYRISLEAAMKGSELGTLGDLMLGTAAPLTMRLRGQGPEADLPLLPGTSEVRFTITDVEFFSEDRVLTDEREKSIASALMMYGRWPVEQLAYRIDGRFAGVEFVARPEVAAAEEGHEQGFDVIGSLSAMFSTQFLAATTDEGVPHRLSTRLDPGVLVRLLAQGYKSKQLPIWRLSLRPADD